MGSNQERKFLTNVKTIGLRLCIWSQNKKEGHERTSSSWIRPMSSKTIH